MTTETSTVGWVYVIGNEGTSGKLQFACLKAVAIT